MVKYFEIRESRIAWLDSSRGLCMLFVVLGHALASNSFNTNCAVTLVPALIYWIYIWHVPSLFFLSGYTSKNLNDDCRYRGSITKLIYVYFIWCSLQTYTIILVPGSNPEFSYPDLLKIPILPNSQFWFIWALIIFHALLHAPRWVWTFTIALCLIILAKLPADSVYYRVAYNLPFYLLGRLLPAVVEIFGNRPGPFALFGFVILSLFFCGATFVAGEMDGHSLYSAPAFVVGFLGILWLTAFSRTILWRSTILRWIGRYSLAILVMHLFFTGGIRIIFPKLLGIHDPIALTCLMVIGGIIGPLIARSIFEKAGIDVWLGLGRSRRCETELRWQCT